MVDSKLVEEYSRWNSGFSGGNCHFSGKRDDFGPGVRAASRENGVISGPHRGNSDRIGGRSDRETGAPGGSGTIPSGNTTVPAGMAAIPFGNAAIPPGKTARRIGNMTFPRGNPDVPSGGAAALIAADGIPKS